VSRKILPERRCFSLHCQVAFLRLRLAPGLQRGLKFDSASLAGRLVEIEVEVVVTHIIASEIGTIEKGRELDENA
jgi:hypothetical protein